MINMKLLCFSLVAAAPRPCSAASQSTHKPEHDVVQINARRYGVALDQWRPLQLLLEELKRNQKARRFRVSWDIAVFNSGGVGTVLYNRDSHIVKYYYVEGREHGSFKQHHLYTNVSDDTFSQVMDDVSEQLTGKGDVPSTNISANAFFFNELLKHGSSRTVLP